MSSVNQSSSDRKRSRIDENNMEDGGTPTPSVVKSSVYFEDGNIILRTLSEDKRVYTHFRVHKSVLSLHCNVFRGMLGEADAPHFATASEQVDGVPLMHLYDEAEDVKEFLRAIYEPEFMQRHHNLEKHGLRLWDYPEMYNGTMKLAKKYEAEKLCDIFSFSLRQAWPSDWNAYKTIPRKHDNDDSLLLPHPAWTIRMAIDLKVHDVLPYAFYDIYGLLAPGAGVVEANGHDASAYVTATESMLSVLTGTETSCLFVGGRRLASYVYEHVSERVLPPIEQFLNCPNDAKRCQEQVLATWKRLRTRLEAAHGAATSLIVIRDATHNMTICQPCLSKLQDKLDELAQDIWSKLPVFFRLNNVTD